MKTWLPIPSRYVLWIILVILVFAVPIFVKDPFVLHLLNLAGIFSILALSFDLVFGYTGLLSVCQASFFGIGAYSSAILTTRLGLSFWLALPISAAIAAAISLGIGYPSLRLRRWYFAIVTMAFAYLMQVWIINVDDLTGGPVGFRSIPRPADIRLGSLNMSFSDKATYYFVIVALLLLTIFVLNRLTHSRLGRAIVAIREDEGVASALGINVRWTLILVYCVSALFGGLAGSIYAHYTTYISPYSFGIMDSILIAVMVIIGGSRTTAGPIVGALFMMIVPEYLGLEPKYRVLLYAALLAGVVLLMPQGIVAAGKAAINALPWLRLSFRSKVAAPEVVASRVAHE